MTLVFYYSMFGMSLVLAIIYAFIFHKHFDVNLTIMTALVPVVNLAFIFMATAKTINEALIPLRYSYIGGCYVLVSAMFLFLNICGVHLNKWVRVAILSVSSIIFASTLTIGYNDIFYKGLPELAFTEDGAAYITSKHYGFMHTVFYIMIGVFYLATIIVIVYSIIKKRQIPKTVLILIIIAISVSVIGFFGGRFITKKVEILPATYNIGVIIYLIIASRLRLYDASDSVTDSLVQEGETGFISFDQKLRYLGANETAKVMFPELTTLKIDLTPKDEWLNENLLNHIKEFKNDESKDKIHIEKNGKIYLLNINNLKMGILNHGYQVLISDDTANQQYINLLSNYNTELEKEVLEKTKHILDMQESLVLGMATMVESRDNSTGGHIKRTSDCVAILIDEIKKDKSFKMDETLMKNVIKAAPMHDLGKIAVDDAVLRKPGKFTPEEYEIMKTHAAEGARIVKQILDGTDDHEFNKVAVNVAHYHHEKWDGTGYPDHLKGEQIPLEARIMAVADVYDALVSKRVYKEKMSFEEANKIILEGMGHHFDPSLEKYYLGAREKLEQYYKNL